MSKRNNTRSKISQLTRSQQPTITLPDTRILCLEKMLQEKIEGKHSNINLGLKKSFSIFDTDQSGALDAEEFTKFLSFYIVGIKIEEVAALTRRIYDINSTNAILIKDFQDRIMSPDAGVRLPTPPQPPPPPSNLPPPLPPPPISQLPRTGNKENRLAKFKAGIKGLVAAQAPKARRKMKLTDRMTTHSSSTDSELVANYSRAKLREVFAKVGNSNGSANISLDSWLRVFQYLTKNPTQPSLHEDDLEALFALHKNGCVEDFIESLFPPPPSIHEKMKRIPGSHYDKQDDCDIGNEEVGFGAFDNSGEGERRVYNPLEKSIPKKINYRFSRTPVQPPSSFDVNSVSLSGRLPHADLTLEQVQGFRGERTERSGEGKGREGRNN